MAIKTSLGYLIYTIVLFVFFVLIGDFVMSIREKISVTGIIPISSYFFSFFTVPLGIILGFPFFIQQYKKDGLWKFNKEKLLFAGIPALYICLYSFLVEYAPSFLTLPPSYLNYRLWSYEVAQFSGIIFGFILVTSIYKVSKANIKQG